MKKGLPCRKILGVLLAAAMLPCSGGIAVSAANDAPIFSETFDDAGSEMSFDEYNKRNGGKWDFTQGADTYQMDTEFSIIKEPGNEGNLVAKLYRPTSNDDSRLTFMNAWLDAAYSTPVIYRFRINRVNEQSRVCGVYFYDYTRKIIDIAFDFINHRFGSGYFTKDAWVPQLDRLGWYDVELAIDFTEQTVALYLRAPGEEKLSYVTTLTIASGNNNGDIKRIAFSTPRTSAGNGAIFYFDDIILEKWPEVTVTGCEQNVDTAGGVDVQFAGELGVESLAEAAVTVAGDAAQVAAVTLSPNDSRTMHIDFAERLEVETQYTLEIAGVKDKYGKAQKRPQQVTFQTRDKKLNVESVRFYREDAGKQTEITETGISAGDITGVFNIENELAEPFSAMVMMAHMRDGKLLDIAVCSKNEIPAETNDRYAVTLKDVSVEGGDTLQLFGWDSLHGMQAVLGNYVLHSRGMAESPMGSAVISGTDVNAAVDYNTGVITVSGTVQPPVSDATVTALALKPGYTTKDITKDTIASAVEYIAQLTSGENGTFSFSYASDGRSNTAVHTVTAGGNQVGENAQGSVSFKCFEANILTDTLAAIKSATPEKMAQLLDGSVSIAAGVTLNDVLQLDLNVYQQLIYKETAHAALAGKEFSTIDQVRETFAKATQAQYQSEDTERSFLKQANNAPWDELESLFKANDAALKLNWGGDYGKLSGDETAMVYKRLALEYTFTRYADVTEAFSKVAAQVLAENPRKTDSSKRSSGGGGGGSSKVQYPPVTPAVPDHTQTPGKPQEPAQTHDFRDIADVAWAAESIKALAERNIINGIGDGLFAPNEAVTREQFVKMLVEALQLEKTAVGAENYTDVDPQAWYAPYVAAACSQGLVQGVDGNTFGTGRPITRAEMAVLAHRAAVLMGHAATDDPYRQYTDQETIPGYALESIAAVQAAGIMNGVDGNRFAPHDGTTRAMAAKVIYGLLQLNV